MRRVQAIVGALIVTVFAVVLARLMVGFSTETGDPAAIPRLLATIFVLVAFPAIILAIVSTEPRRRKRLRRAGSDRGTDAPH